MARMRTAQSLSCYKYLLSVIHMSAEPTHRAPYSNDLRWTIVAGIHGIGSASALITHYAFKAEICSSIYHVVLRVLHFSAHCVSVCLSVKLYLTSGMSVHPENTVMYSAGNGGQKCVFL